MRDSPLSVRLPPTAPPVSADAISAGPRARRPLSPADVFTRVLDREARRDGLPGFQSLAVLALDSRPDVETLRGRLAADTPLARCVRARMTRSVPLLRPCWDLAGRSPPPRVDVLAEAPSAGPPFTSLLAARLRPDRGENLRFTLFPADDGSWRLGFLFHHALVDARAAERLLAALAEGQTAGHWPPPPPAPPPLGERLRLAKAQNEAIESAIVGGLHVFASATDGPVRRMSGDVVALDGKETSDAVTGGRRAAGYGMEGLWYLACLLAADRETDPRPPGGASYLVPLPTTLDGVGETLRTFGNHLWFNFLSVPVADAVEPAATARALRGQLMEALRGDARNRCRAQLDLFRLMPAPIYAALARSTTGGAFASLFFTHPGRVDRRLTSLLGAEVTGFAHFPSPLPVPGVCATVWTFRGRLSLGLTWVEDRVSGDRARGLLRRWRDRVLGEGTTE